MSKLKWGILSSAQIGMNKVIPGIQKSSNGTVHAIASRNASRAAEAAAEAGIPVSCGSYEELLADPEIEALYIPLPNHLHREWCIRAMEAGKHVLCEKPLAMDAAEVREMIKVRNRTGRILSEAFMVRHHPQWLRAREIVRGGDLGELRQIQGFFSYNNIDEGNIRNIPEYGGGGLMDIGCYPVTMSRFIYGEEPLRVAAVMERDPRMRIDRLTSAVMEFSGGQAAFTCSTQLVPYQRMNLLGTAGRLEVEIPFNAPADKPCRVFMARGEFYQEETELLEFPVCDQYSLQAESFVRTIRGEEELVVPPEDSLKNMKVMEAIFRAGKSGKWEDVK